MFYELNEDDGQLVDEYEREDDEEYFCECGDDLEDDDDDCYEDQEGMLN